MSTIELLKQWIVRRFLEEYEFRTLSAVHVLAWSAALKELSQLVKDEIVPFHRRQGDKGES